MIISSIGHRFYTLPGQPTRRLAEDIYGYTLMNLVTAYLDERKPTKVISGATIGFDLLVAWAALQGGHPYEIVLAHERIDAKWDETAKRYLAEVLDGASRVTTLSKGTRSTEKIRRQTMHKIHNADRLLVFWDGRNGPIHEAVTLAYVRRREVDNLWRDFVAHSKRVSL